MKPKTIGERLKKKRMDMDSFQKDVARFLDVSTNTITYWEKGRIKPSKRNLLKIKGFLKMRKTKEELNSA